MDVKNTNTSWMRKAGFAMPLLFMAMLVLSMEPSLAGDENGAADALYLYYQAEMDEDIDAFMSYVDASHVAAGDREEYLNEIRALNLALFELYDTRSFELTDADVFISSDGSDARIFYHLSSELSSASGDDDNNDNGPGSGVVEIDNEFVAVMHDSGDGWKITYVIPRTEYENRRLIVSAVSSAISNQDAVLSSDDAGSTGAGISGQDRLKGSFDDNSDDASSGSFFGFFAKIIKALFGSGDDDDNGSGSTGGNSDTGNNKGDDTGDGKTSDASDNDDKSSRDDGSGDASLVGQVNLKKASCADIQKEYVSIINTMYSQGMAGKDTTGNDARLKEIDDAVYNERKKDCITNKDESKRTTIISMCNSYLSQYQRVRDADEAALRSMPYSYDMPKDMQEKIRLILLKSCIDTNPTGSLMVSPGKSLPYGCMGKYKAYADASHIHTTAINDVSSGQGQKDAAGADLAAAEEAYDSCVYEIAQPGNGCDAEYGTYIKERDDYIKNRDAGLQQAMLGVYGNRYEAARSAYELCRNKNPVETESGRAGCEDAYYKYMLTVRASQKAEAESSNDQYKQSMKQNMVAGYKAYQKCLEEQEDN